MQEPKENAEKQDTAIHGNGPVHGDGGDGGAGGPKREEDGQEAVGDGKDVDGDAEVAKAERAPAHGGCRGCESFEEQHGGRDEERGVKCRDDEASEGIKRRRGADVDECEEHVDSHGETDRPQR